MPIAFCMPVSAADIESAVAHHRASADVEILLDRKDRSALLACSDCRNKPASTGAENDDVDLTVPARRTVLLSGGGYGDDGAERPRRSSESCADRSTHDRRSLSDRRGWAISASESLLLSTFSSKRAWMSGQSLRV